EKIQRALLDLGYALPRFGADGVYGSETEAAVREFQRDSGFATEQLDGRVGPITMEELDRRFAGTESEPPMPGGEAPSRAFDPVEDGEMPEGPTIPAKDQSIEEQEAEALAARPEGIPPLMPAAFGFPRPLLAKRGEQVPPPSTISPGAPIKRLSVDLSTGK